MFQHFYIGLIGMAGGIGGIGNPDRRLGFALRFFQDFWIHLTLTAVCPKDVCFGGQGLGVVHGVEGVIRAGRRAMGGKKKQLFFANLLIPPQYSGSETSIRFLSSLIRHNDGKVLQICMGQGKSRGKFIHKLRFLSGYVFLPLEECLLQRFGQ